MEAHLLALLSIDPVSKVSFELTVRLEVLGVPSVEASEAHLRFGVPRAPGVTAGSSARMAFGVGISSSSYSSSLEGNRGKLFRSISLSENR